jgi:hypothetical protein
MGGLLPFMFPSSPDLGYYFLDCLPQTLLECGPDLATSFFKQHQILLMPGPFLGKVIEIGFRVSSGVAAVMERHIAIMLE